MKNKKIKGFTLVELIVVIVILAVLVGVSIGGIYSWVNKARQNTDINNCKAIENALNEGLLGEKFPSVGISYAHCFVMDSARSDNVGNMFIQSYLIGADGRESASQTEDGRSDIILSNNKRVDKSVFENRIKNQLALNKNGYTKILANSKTNYYYVGFIYVDEQGNFIKAKCILYDYKGTSNNYYKLSRGLVPYYCYDYFNPSTVVPAPRNDGTIDDMKWIFSNSSIDEAKKYIIYDGNINKFEN